jgi:hypothetical protein
MAILGFNSLVVLPVLASAVLEYGYERNFQHPFLQNGTTTNYRSFSESTQQQGNETTLDDFTKIIGNQTIEKMILRVTSNANLNTTSIDLRHSSDLLSWSTQATLFTIATLATGTYIITPDESMNDNEYYLTRGSSSGSGQLIAQFMYRIQVL